MNFNKLKELKETKENIDCNVITESKLLDTPCDRAKYYNTDLYLVPCTTSNYQDPAIQSAMYVLGELHEIDDDGEINSECTHVLVLPSVLHDGKEHNMSIYRKCGNDSCIKILYAVFLDMKSIAMHSFVRKFDIEFEWKQYISEDMTTSTLRRFYIDKYKHKRELAYLNMKKAQEQYDEDTMILARLGVKC